jgi:hypothetical protein
MPDPTDIVWHILQPGGETEDVPDLINNTTNLVRSMLDQSKTWAEQSLEDARKAMGALQDAKGPETLPDPPDVPSIQTKLSAQIGLSFDTPPSLGDISPPSVGFFTPDAVVIPDITAELGDYVPLITGLSIPDPPTLNLPAEPTEPGVETDFDLPDAPVPAYGGAPDLVEFNLPVYVAPTLPLFDDEAPTFATLPPSPFIQWQEPVYTSTIKDAVSAVIQTMLAGGTGLTDETVLAMWERARVREDVGARTAIQQAEQQWAAKGFSLPGGPVTAIIMAATEAAAQRSNELSREQMIKEADLEQQNRQFAVEKALGFETIFTGVFLQVVERNFQIAKFAVETQIQIYNMEIASFTARGQVFAMKIELFKAKLEEAFALIKAFEAQVAAERAKGELNQQKLAAFTARVQAFNSQVEAFKGLVAAATMRAELEKNKIEVFKGQVDASVAQVNGQRAVFEAYGARVSAESAKANLEQANAHAYSAKVQGIAAKAEISIKRADAQIQNSRMKLEYSVGNLQRSTQLVQQQLSVIQANAAVYDVTTKKALAKFEADKQLRVVELQTNIELGKLGIAKYSAMLEQWRTRAQQILSVFSVNAESLKAAGQIAATLAAGAMAGTHVSAGVSGSAGATQGKNINSQKSQSFQQSVSDQNNYSTQHIYNHEV